MKILRYIAIATLLALPVFADIGGYAPPAIQTAHGCRVFETSAQSFSQSVAAAITFTSERDDTDGYHSTATNTSRITVPGGLAGVYLINCQAGFVANASTYQDIRIRLNGSTLINTTDSQAYLSASIASQLQATTTYRLVAGDYVECMLDENNATSVNTLIAANAQPEFMAYLIGR